MERYEVGGRQWSINRRDEDICVTAVENGAAVGLWRLREGHPAENWTDAKVIEYLSTKLPPK